MNSLTLTISRAPLLEQICRQIARRGALGGEGEGIAPLAAKIPNRATMPLLESLLSEAAAGLCAAFGAILSEGPFPDSDAAELRFTLRLAVQSPRIQTAELAELAGAYLSDRTAASWLRSASDTVGAEHFALCAARDLDEILKITNTRVRPDRPAQFL
ncbi:MAG: hypothetical protein NC336_06545 [Clostridium sp.]|nr:hypothetical protein [Clostridium sp.]